jgi:hypothetical protein
MYAHVNKWTIKKFLKKDVEILNKITNWNSWNEKLNRSNKNSVENFSSRLDQTEDNSVFKLKSTLSGLEDRVDTDEDGKEKLKKYEWSMQHF